MKSEPNDVNQLCERVSSIELGGPSQHPSSEDNARDDGQVLVTTKTEVKTEHQDEL